MAAIKHVVLLGGGHAHLGVLRYLSQQPDLAQTMRISLVSPYTRQIYSGMLPGWIAGHYDLNDITIALDTWVRATAAQWHQDHCVRLDAAQQVLTLASGVHMPYDVLSINTGASLNVQALNQQIPGVAQYALPLRPLDHCVTQLQARLPQLQGNVCVIGAGAGGVELALALAHRIGQSGQSGQVHLFTNAAVSDSVEQGVANAIVKNYPQGARKRIANALQAAGVQLHFSPVHSITAQQVCLANGQCVPQQLCLLAIGAQAPQWLAESGLALDEQGFIQVNAYQQSISHPNVFAAGDVASRVDSPHPKSGVYAVRAGLPLGRNLQAAVLQKPLTAYQPQSKTLNILACGSRHAIATWGRYSIEGDWVWRWKDRIDRGFIRRFSGDWAK